ncbi:hypothetical protein DFQ27_005520 [Actinomortierella ambigua]|uniref:Blue (type 1) copper domain-containing protein n=1 Tax=Actinomortierella ambigua TaxID=1343610 RepID=A0A9P6U2T3_9FUNG|nr:hypothetical protein DFQ26_002475 [Actinomortierella ambigua]KAG0256740.1 hypothetical protein DFQ27_005520 [Actinomortierella ambigua]
MHCLKLNPLLATLLAATLFVSLAKAAEHLVNIQNNAFSPPSITVNAGDTVRWVNLDAVAHTSTSDTAGLWDSKSLAKGQNFTRPFGTEATYTYHCTPHPFMKGTVIVKAQGTGGAPKPSASTTGSQPPASGGNPTSTSTPTPTQRSEAPATRRADVSMFALLAILVFVQQLAF